MGSVMWLVGHKVSHGVIQGVSHGAGEARSMHREQSWNYLELCREICAAHCCFDIFQAKICHEGSFSIALFFEANLECTAHQMKASYMSKVTLSRFDI